VEKEMALDAKTWTGGARIDLQNATWPFAKLTLSSDSLVLSVASSLTYRFDPDQVTWVEEITAMPVIGRGVRLHHNVVGYPQQIVFWCFRTQQLLDELHDRGYKTAPPEEAVPTKFPGERASCVVMMIILLIMFLSCSGILTRGCNQLH
jgi:hypothetical protein